MFDADIDYLHRECVPKESFCIPNNQFLSYILSFPPLLTPYGSWLFVLLAGNNPISPRRVWVTTLWLGIAVQGRNLGQSGLPRAICLYDKGKLRLYWLFCQPSFSVGGIEVWDDLGSPGSLNTRLPKLVSVRRILLYPARYFFF